MNTRTIDDLREILAAAHRQNWFAVFTHDEARQLLDEIERLRTRTVQAETDATEARQYAETLEVINAATLAGEVDDLVERLTEAEAMLARLRSVLQEIKAEPMLSAWTAKKFREAAAQALEEMGKAGEP